MTEREKNNLLLWQQKMEFDTCDGVLVGVDEVGRGPLAGDVVAAAVILPKDVQILGLKDSKKISEKKRELLYDEICEKAIAIGIGKVSPQEIDEINILQATFKAMRMALDNIGMPFSIIYVDGDKQIPNIAYTQKAIIGGDDKSASIAAASVIAKVTRDRDMIKYGEVYPDYDFGAHKGYGTKKHYEALDKFGITDIHRKSFLKKYFA